jgi:hypothetical protein
MGSQHSIVGMVTKLRSVRSEFRIAAEGRDVSLLRNVQLGCEAHPPSYSMGMGAIYTYMAVKRTRHQADHLSPSWAELKNEWRYNSTFLMCLRGMCSDSFTLPNWELTVWNRETFSTFSINFLIPCVKSSWTGVKKFWLPMDSWARKMYNMKFEIVQVVSKK